MGICIKKALNIINDNVNKVSFEIIAIEFVQNRISAQEVYAKLNLPNFNNSAMDGYAIKLTDAGKKVKVIDCILAGSSKQTIIKNKTCVKIMTGARVPSSTQAIVPIEEVKIINDNYIQLPKTIKNNQHIRFVGEDIKKNELLLNIGDEINFATISILASQGISYLKVYRQVNVSVFTSGDELKLHYEDIKDYQLYNSNTPTLLARVKELGTNTTFTGIANDNIDSIKDIINNSLYTDFIITSGGISVGDTDLTKDAFNYFDVEVLFDGINIKPGKPTVFSKINNTYILNLPGNPLAASLIFEMIGKIIIQQLSGSNKVHHNYIKSKLKQELTNKKGRTTIIPGYFDGEYFKASKKRLPGMVSVLHNCNSLLVLNKYKEIINKNEEIKIIPIDWKFFSKEKKDVFN